MENDEIIRNLAISIAHKERVIGDLNRKLTALQVERDQFQAYWLEDSKALRDAQKVIDQQAESLGKLGAKSNKGN